jgi:hypothetical protein
MNRSWHCIAAASLALLLAAAPAAALGPANREPPNASGSRIGWLTVLADWVQGLIGDRGGEAPGAVAAGDGATSDGPPPQNGSEPPASSETDGGPHWDPGG